MRAEGSVWLLCMATLLAGGAARAQDGAASAAQEQAAQDAEPEQEAVAEDTQAQAESVDPAIFDAALGHYYDHAFADAAAGFWGYMQAGGENAQNYEWAEFFLAESLRALELWHGAVQYYYRVAKRRSQPEVLPEALDRLENISRQRPFNEALVYEDLLYDSEFGSLPKRLGNWVHYVQGLYDFRNGFLTWGDRHFDMISQSSRYWLRAMYVKAVHALKEKRDDEARLLLEVIAESAVDDPEIKNKASLAMARLLFDLGQHRAAMERYAEVKQLDLSFEQAELLLEKAWTAAQLGEPQKAMGLLYALEAPSYRVFFLPDAHLLRAILLKDLCHFIPAKRALRSFRFEFEQALDDLRRRLPLRQIRRVIDGAVQEGAIARRTAFMETLAKERERIEDHDALWEEVGLAQHLRKLYDVEAREQRRLWELEFDQAADGVALELLEVEEQVNLLDYEVGLDIFKRIKLTGVVKELEEGVAIPYDSANVYYEHDVEFWNDELHSYQYFINNRCFEFEGAGG